jgi:hypothetical protein
MSMFWMVVLILFSSVNIAFVTLMRLVFKRQLKNSHRDMCYGFFCLQLGVVVFYMMYFEKNVMFLGSYIALMWIGFFCFKGRTITL